MGKGAHAHVETQVTREKATETGFNERVEGEIDSNSEGEPELDIHIYSLHEVKEKCCFCPYEGNKGELCFHIANDCEIVGYEKPSDMNTCKEIKEESLDKYSSEEVVILDEDKDSREVVLVGKQVDASECFDADEDSSEEFASLDEHEDNLEKVVHVGKPEDARFDTEEEALAKQQGKNAAIVNESTESAEPSYSN